MARLCLSFEQLLLVMNKSDNRQLAHSDVKFILRLVWHHCRVQRGACINSKFFLLLASMTFGIHLSLSTIPTYQEQILSPHEYALAHIVLRLKHLYERQTLYL